MKCSSLIALVVATPLAVLSQTAVFTDNFSNGSTTNLTSMPGGTPTASSTSYDIASSKTAEAKFSPGDLKLSLSGNTTSGFWEAQALFVPTLGNSPIALASVGDFINLTYVFTNTTGTLLAAGTSSAIFTGLYNSEGQPPVAGGALVKSGLNSSAGSPYATGNCADWQGYVSSITGNGGSSKSYTRPIQNGAGTTSANQELLGNAFGSGAFNNPVGAQFGSNEVSTAVLASGATYTVSYTIALTAAGTLTITNNLYSGAGTGGSLLFSETNSTIATDVLTTSFDGLGIAVRSSGTSMNPEMDISQIAIAASIASWPGPLFSVTGGGTTCPGEQIAVNLSGSVSTNVYFLYTNGVVDAAIPPIPGTGSAITFAPETVMPYVLTNTVVASNTVSAKTGLMIGGVLAVPVTAPVIVQQPSPLVVATNSTGEFSVVCAAGAGLNFQWYANGVGLNDGGSYSGCTSSNLVVSPATVAVAAISSQGYYCIISNSCGLSTNSITNSLTLDAPANLVWQGGNPNANWDLDTTSNFTNSPGNFVVFNGGDDVTFDDSSINPVVYLDSSLLAPTLINVTANANNYAFTGSGRIIGAGSLLMSGSTTLSISNANSFSGGTTISSGVVAVDDPSQMALGVGSVTMAGGELLVNASSGAPPGGMSNNVIVAANSTLQFNGTSTYALNLMGTLSGSGGATLTIQTPLDNSATADRVRLYGSFTNDSSISINSAGNEVEISPYNATGSQVYNGNITGIGGRLIPRGNGNVILNGINTFNDSGTVNNGNGPSGYSTVLSGSTVGLGADSVGSFGSLTSSPLGTGNVGIDVTLGNVTLYASGGAHTIANELIYTSATNTVTLVIGGSNNFTWSGPIQLNGADNTGNTNWTFEVENTALTTFSGVLGDAGLSCGLNLTGTNSSAIYLDGINTYIGPTTVYHGLLAGIGTIAGPVTVTNGGTIGGGDAGAVGTLTISNNLVIANSGDVFIRVDKSSAPSNDVIAVVNSGTITASGTGTVTVTNIGIASLVVGDRFQIFSGAVAGGSSLVVTGVPGVVWNNNLPLDGSISVAAIGSSASTNDFLNSLVVSPGGTLTPAFSTNVFVYSASNYLPNNPVTVTVVNAGTPATNVLYFNGVSQGLLPSGTPSAPLSLSEDVNNLIQVTVTAQNGIAVNTYTVNASLLPSQTEPALTRSVSGKTLSLSWPSDHLGYRLLVQTNNLQRGVSTNLSDWSTVAGSTSVTSTNLIIEGTHLDEYYRLVYP